MFGIGSFRHPWPAVLLALVVAGWAGTAAALSFTIPTGAWVVDVELSDTPTSTSYDGTSETFSIVAGVDIIRVDNAGIIEDIILGAGDVEMSIQVSLQGVIINGGSVLLGTYSNGTSDFTITDLGGAIPEVIFAGDFIDGADLQMSVAGMLIMTGVLSGRYDSQDLDNDFDNAIMPTGYLSVNFSNIQVGGQLAMTTNILDSPFTPTSPGFNDFTAFQVADMTPDPIPEPATGWLLALGIAALAAGSRRLR